MTLPSRTPLVPRSIATVLGVGYIHRFPATPIGSAAGIALWVLTYLLSGGSMVAQVILFAVILVAGCWATRVHLGRSGGTDPQEIVIDETCGMLIALIGLPLNAPLLFLGWFLFHVFDVTKVSLVGRAERLSGWVGVMADDLVAGIYAAVLLHLTARIFT